MTTLLDELYEEDLSEMEEGRGTANGKEGDWYRWGRHNVFIPDDPDMDPIAPSIMQPYAQSLHKAKKKNPSWRGKRQRRDFTAKSVDRAGSHMPTEGGKHEGGGLLKKLSKQLGKMSKRAKSAFRPKKGDMKESVESPAFNQLPDRLSIVHYRHLYEQMCQEEGVEPDLSVILEAREAEDLIESVVGSYLAAQMLYGMIALGIFLSMPDRWELAHRKSQLLLKSGGDLSNPAHNTWYALGEISDAITERMAQAGFQRYRVLKSTPEPGSEKAKKLMDPILRVSNGEAVTSFREVDLNAGLDYIAYWRERFPGKNAVARLKDAISNAASRLFGGGKKQTQGESIQFSYTRSEDLS